MTSHTPLTAGRRSRNASWLRDPDTPKEVIQADNLRRFYEANPAHDRRVRVEPPVPAWFKLYIAVAFVASVFLVVTM